MLRDAEAAGAIIHVLERMGMFLAGEMLCLAEYEGYIKGVAGCSLLAKRVPKAAKLHIPFFELYRSVREARNTAMHEGAYARHLATHAVKLALVLENALMNGLDLVRDLMVPNPVCAEMWQPLSFIRQTMLENSFSHLPVRTSGDGLCTWKLVSDESLARYLRAAGTAEGMKQRLVQPLAEAVQMDGIRFCEAKQCDQEETVSSVIAEWNGLPILVVRKDSTDLMGILTAFDLL
ncbi:MAG TPA: hypothetical protein VNZ64_23110 [Candidatus Acidoferrum sp.]|nr:hypothetical protein [Candidatus Acidoferrum sp.]